MILCATFSWLAWFQISFVPTALSLVGIAVASLVTKRDCWPSFVFLIVITFESINLEMRI